MQQLSALATANAARPGSIMWEGTARVRARPFHSDRDPEGIINLGTAENTLMSDVITQVRF
jgi:hypothetical protein